MNLSGATDTEEKENVTCGFCRTETKQAIM